MSATNVYRTAVYRLYATDGQLLYIGMAGNLHARMLEHRRVRPWWGLVDPSRTTVTWFMNRPEATAAEREAIRRESPRFNVLGTPKHGTVYLRRPRPNALGLHRLAGTAEIREVLGVSRQRVQQLISRSDFPEPYDTLSMGKVWLRQDVETWARARQMRLTGGSDGE